MADLRRGMVGRCRPRAEPNDSYNHWQTSLHQSPAGNDRVATAEKSCCVSTDCRLPVAFSANDGADYRSGVHSRRVRIRKGLQPRVSQFVLASM
jgi:hypothetical protein